MGGKCHHNEFLETIGLPLVYSQISHHVSPAYLSLDDVR